MTIKKRVLQSAAWTLLGFSGAQVLRLAANLIMTRMLDPSMFGVMAIVTTIMVGVSLFTDLGFRENIIQSKRGDEPDFLNTVWTLQVLRGLLLWGLSILAGIAIWLAQNLAFVQSHSAYADPRLPWVIPFTSISLVFMAFEPTWTTTSIRKLEQAKLTMIELGSQLGGLLLGLGWIVVDKSIWALAFISVGASVVRIVMVYRLMDGPRNHWHLEPQAIHEVLHFGKWLFLTSITGFLFMNGDRLLLGGLVSAHELGIYTVAYFMMNALGEVARKLYSNVAFPAISETIRHAPDTTYRVYYKFRSIFDSVLLLATGMLYESSSLLINFLYDSRYVAAGHMLKILSLSVIGLRYSIVDQCLIAFGKPKLLLYLIILRTITLLTCIPWAYHVYGMDGVLWAIVVSNIVSVPLALLYMRQFGLFSLRYEMLTLAPLPIGMAIGWGINHLF